MSKLLSTLLAIEMMTNSSAQIERPIQKVCKRAKGNGKYGVKCKHGGSCEDTRPRCRFAIY